MCMCYIERFPGNCENMETPRDQLSKFVQNFLNFSTTNSVSHETLWFLAHQDGQSPYNMSDFLNHLKAPKSNAKRQRLTLGNWNEFKVTIRHGAGMSFIYDNMILGGEGGDYFLSKTEWHAFIMFLLFKDESTVFFFWPRMYDIYISTLYKI